MVAYSVGVILDVWPLRDADPKVSFDQLTWTDYDWGSDAFHRVPGP